MIHRLLTLRFWAFCIGLFPVLLHAQGWQRVYGDHQNERAFALQLLPDGGLLAAGSVSDSIGLTTDLYFFKTDSAGTLGAEQKWGDTLANEYIKVILPLPNGGYKLYGAGYNDLYPAQTEAITYTGENIDSVRKDLNGLEVLHAFQWADDIVLLGTEYHDFPGGQVQFSFHYKKLDAAGNVLWEKDSLLGEFDSKATTGCALNANEALIAGVYQENSENIIYARKIDANGAILRDFRYDGTAYQTVASVLKHPSGNVILAGTGNYLINQKDLVLIALTPDLDSLWARVIPIPGNQEAHTALALPNGNIVVAGEHIPEGAQSRDGFLAMFDALGNLLWFKTYGGFKGDIFWDIKPSPDGNGFILAGQTASFSLDGNLQAWLLRTDSLGTVYSNRLIGRVWRDAVENCVPDNNEPSIQGWLVEASGNTGTYYTLSDSLGQYEMNVDTGLWYVSVLPPSGYWSPCEDSVTVDMPQLGDTVTVDFPVQALYNCPLLDVDVTTPFLRRCHENTYSVRYFNYGTAAAPDAQISITLDPYLMIATSDLPYTQSGDTLFFSVGVVDPLEGGSFYFNASLDCDSTILGQTHCVEAHIMPDSICYSINPEWDGAHLEVDGNCMGDSVLLRVTNTGLDMQGAVNYIIVEDQIIFKQSTLQLAGGQDTTFVLHPNGSTVTIIVYQTPGHPGNNQPLLVIEGCGDFPFNTGYALQFPQNDGDPSTDIECRQNIGSFDPNDKIGLPEGVGEEHVIDPETTIEYLIRFQNTGTDTAFRVEIRDTLPSSLDLATLRVGGSSHPYQWNISGSGVLQFLFDPIALPDSGANWAASNGFVKFRIAAKKDLAHGTVIENRAAIYFDQNEPVITAQTLHTLGNPFQFLITSTTQPMNTNTTYGALLASPNPTPGNITMHLAQPLNSEGLRLGLLDALGRELKAWEGLDGQQKLDIDLGSLPAGVYFFQLKNKEKQIIASGKVIKN